MIILQEQHIIIIAIGYVQQHELNSLQALQCSFFIPYKFY